MKKIVIVLAAMFSLNTGVFADGLTATLQQGDVMTPFYGVDAFKQAYEAATDGAVITLSSGQFSTVTEIAKSVSIVGVYAFDVNSPEVTYLPATVSITSNNVKFEGIYFNQNVTIGGVSNCHIKRCWINGILTSSTTHTNTLIDQCVVKNDAAIATGNNYTVQNSTIGQFSKSNTTNNIAYITNCFIYYWAFRTSSGFNTTYCRPYAIYKNNVLGLNNYGNSGNINLSLSSPSEFYYNYFYRFSSSNSNNINYISPIFGNGCINQGNSISGTSSPWVSSYTYPNMDASYGNGQDETPRGITGGKGFSEYPSIPRIIDRQIDANTNAEGKINVKITVETN